jgi:exopolyphosphatase/guanosine-5'-triphosphate,3'-diphosphate pyrophosphatase
MIIILRIAILIHRDRVPKKLPNIKVEKEEECLIVKIDKKWLKTHPLTDAELEQEQNYLKVLPINIRF